MSVIFHHIPKTGGTSVMTACQKAIGGSCARASFGDRVKNGRVYLERHRYPNFASSHYAFFEAMGYQKRDEDFLFTWLRHPVDLFWSGCRFYRLPGKPHPDYWPGVVKMEMEEHLIPAVSIKRYIDLILEKPEKKELRKIDRVSVFPVRWFDDDWERYDFIGFLERMDTDLRELSNRLGVSLDPMKVNLTQKREGVRAEDAAIDREYMQYRRPELERFFAPEIRSYVRAMEAMAKK